MLTNFRLGCIKNGNVSKINYVLRLISVYPRVITFERVKHISIVVKKIIKEVDSLVQREF